MKTKSAIAIFFFLFSLSALSFAQDAGKGDEFTEADPRCAHRGERGPCKAFIESWHYDPVSNSCKAFFWGGCGEPKPFSSEKECRSACACDKGRSRGQF
ncbi:MAG: BPTI/Kunitz-type proteinase inhibitor domain-containing protein [Syntrophaceae bacterium]